MCRVNHTENLVKMLRRNLWRKNSGETWNTRLLRTKMHYDVNLCRRDNTGLMYGAREVLGTIVCWFTALSQNQNAI